MRNDLLEMFYVEDEKVKKELSIWLEKSSVLQKRIPFLYKALSKVGDFDQKLKVITTSSDNEEFIDYLKVIDKNGTIFEFPLIFLNNKDVYTFKEYLSDRINTYSYCPIRKRLKNSVEVSLISSKYPLINGKTLTIRNAYGPNHPKVYSLEDGDYKVILGFINNKISDDKITSLCALRLPSNLEEFLNTLSELIDFNSIDHFYMKELIEDKEISYYEITRGNILEARYNETTDNYELNLKYKEGKLEEEYKEIKRITSENLDDESKKKVHSVKEIITRF